MTCPYALIVGIAGIAAGTITNSAGLLILGFFCVLLWFAFDLRRLGAQARAAGDAIDARRDERLGL